MAHYDRVVPPGGEGKIKLTVHTTGYRSKFTKTAQVTTNDPLNTMSRLSVSAEIFNIIEVSPAQARLRGDGTKALSSRVVIKPQKEDPLVLTPESFTLADKMSYSIEEVEKGKVFQITFTTKAPPDGSYQGVLKLKTNYPEKPELPIHVSVVVRRPPSIVMTPRTLRLRGPVATELKGKVVIESKSNEPLQLTPVNLSQPEKLTYVLEENEKGKTFTVHFVTKPAALPESYQAMLNLKTNCKDQPNIRIYVVVIVR